MQGMELCVVGNRKKEHLSYTAKMLQTLKYILFFH